MEDPIQRARLRFKSILESAEQAADWAVQDRPGIARPTSLVVIATKAMNRATGFLEAVSIVVPELGPELLEEFVLQRQSNMLLINNLSDEAASRIGTANEKQISTRAIAYIMAGHVRHHVGILKERYLA